MVTECPESYPRRPTVRMKMEPVTSAKVPVVTQLEYLSSCGLYSSYVSTVLRHDYTTLVSVD